MSREDRIEQYPSSVLEKGYGVVGKYVMQDRRLNPIAKALYAYICTFGNIAFPGRDKICYDLQINKNTYSKYMRQLVDRGYITVRQKRGAGNSFQRNVYVINLDPAKVMRENAEVKEPKETDEFKKTPESENLEEKEEVSEAVSQEIGHGENQGSVRVLFGGTPSRGTPSNRTLNNTTTTIIQELNKTTTTPECLSGLENDVVVLNEEGARKACKEKAFSICEEFGIQEATVQRFIKDFGETFVCEQAELMKQTAKRTGLRNPAGWLRMALEKEFVDSEKAFRQAQEHKKEEARKRNEARVEQALREMEIEATEQQDHAAPKIDESSPFYRFLRKKKIQ